MTLSELKNRVDIIQVAQELGLKLDKNQKCLCPFHKEKTASLQFSQKKQIATCFSGNCDVGTMDVIDLVKKFYSWEIPQVVEWLKPLAGSVAPTGNYSIVDHSTPKPSTNYTAIFESLKEKLGKSSKARDYLKDRHLDYKKLEAAYNAGTAYNKLKNCIIFPLKNKSGAISSLYGRSVSRTGNAKHFYTSDRKGLFPSYPPTGVRYLIITESIIDTITLQQHFSFSSETTLLASYGTNGIIAEHFGAIKDLKQLQEITFYFDGDGAGDTAAEKYAKQLHELYPKLTISKVEMLEGEDINSILDTHEPEIFEHLYKSRKQLYATAEKTATNHAPKITIQPNQTTYQDTELKIDVLGKIDRKNLGALKVTLVVYKRTNLEQPPSRNTVDLYRDDVVEKLIRKIAEKLAVGTSHTRKALDQLTRTLEAHRLEVQKEAPQQKQRYALRDISIQEQQQSKQLLERKDLKRSLTQLLQQTGIIGEEHNSLFLFTILLSHKMHRTLHAMVQGTSGSGKSHLIAKVADCMYDQNKIKRFTRVTDKSFYNYGEQDLCNCGIVLEDYDGLTEEAELAWRELQSNGKLSSSVSQKNEQTGEITTGEKYVFGPIASLVATTHFRVYEDNESRVFMVAIDESEAQTEKVLEYMAKKASKVITSNQEQEAVSQIQNITYMLKPYEVQNPYRLQLPKTTKQRRRLTQMLHDYIEQITLLHQYQRKQENNMLITELQDLEIAVELMFSSIVLKTDELDGILRQFYENLKSYVEKQGKNYEFTQREIRQHFRISKTQMFRYMNELQELEYITRSSIGARNMFKFQISYWDNIEKLRQEIKAHLQQQIANYRKPILQEAQ